MCIISVILQGLKVRVFPPDKQDPVSWLKMHDADSNFIKQVKNTLNGLYDPIEFHSKIDIIIFGYLQSVNQQHQIIPNDIVVLCQLFINDDSDDANRAFIIDNDKRRSVNPNHNIKWPQNVILTIFGDFNGKIVNKNTNSMVILNVIGTFSGSVICRDGNMLIKCKKYVQSEGEIYIVRAYLYDGDKPCTHQKSHKYGNIMIICDKTARTGEITSDHNLSYWGNSAIQRYKTKASSCNKNLFGNIYIKSNGMLTMQGQVRSGHIYIECGSFLGGQRWNTGKLIPKRDGMVLHENNDKIIPIKSSRTAPCSSSTTM